MKKQKWLVVLLIFMMVYSNISYAIPIEGTETDIGFYLLGQDDIYYYDAVVPVGVIDTLSLPALSTSDNQDFVLDYNGNFYITDYNPFSRKTSLKNFVGNATFLDINGMGQFLFDRDNQPFYMTLTGDFYKYVDGSSDEFLKTINCDIVLDIAFNNSCTSLFVLYELDSQVRLDILYFDYDMNYLHMDTFSNIGDYTNIFFASDYLHFVNTATPMFMGQARDERMTIDMTFNFPEPEPMTVGKFASIGRQDIEITDENGLPVQMVDLHIGTGYEPPDTFQMAFKDSDGFPLLPAVQIENGNIIEVDSSYNVTPLTRGTSYVDAIGIGEDSVLFRVWESRIPSFEFLEDITEENEGEVIVRINENDEYWLGLDKLCVASALNRQVDGSDLLEPLEADLRIKKNGAYVSIEDTTTLEPGEYVAAIVAKPELWMELSFPQKNFTLIVNPIAPIETTVDIGPDVDLDCGFLAWNTDYTIMPSVVPEASPDQYVWDVASNGAFTFDEETMTITSLADGSGSISLTVDGVTDTLEVDVTELVPDYLKDDLFLEYNGIARGHLGIKLRDEDTIVEIEMPDGSYVSPFDFIYDTTKLGRQTIHFRIRLDSEPVEDSTTEYYDVYQEINVVNSNLDDVIVLTDDDDADSELIYYDFVNNRFVYVTDLNTVMPRASEPLADVAVGKYDEIFLIYGQHLYSLDLDTDELVLWDTDILYDAQSLIGFEGLDFDIDGKIYLTTGTTLVTGDLNYETHALENHVFGEIDSRYDLRDIAVNRLGDEAYLVGKIKNTHAEVLKARYNLASSTIDYETSWMAYDTTSYTGIAYTPDHNYIIQDTYDGPIIHRYYHDLVSQSSIGFPYPMYANRITGAGSRYPTQITASDVSLDVGYQKTTSDSQKPILKTVDPYYRMDYPATYEKISGSGFDVNEVTGIVTGTASGSGQIKITVDGASTIIDVNVTYHSAPSNTSPTIRVSVSPDPIELDAGPGAEITSVTAEASVTGTTNDTVTWSTADTGIATVDENGVVTAVAEGQTTLIARAYNGSSDTVEVIVFFVDEEINPLGLVEFYSPYISGYPDQSFRPNNIVTRAELATMFSRILGLDLEVSGTPFGDINGHWAQDYILAASKAGLFAGYKDGSFKPEQEISRAEIAAVISNYWDYFKLNLTPEPLMINDVPTGHWASSYVYKLYNAGLITESTDKNYRPDDGTLREEVVVILNVLIDREPLSKETPTFSDVQSSNPIKGDIEAASSSAPIKDK